MTVPNGRPATQSDVYLLEQRLDKRLDRFELAVTSTLDRHGGRIRTLEDIHRSEEGEDRATQAAERTEQTVRSERTESRKWLISLTVGVVFSAVSSTLGLAALIT